MIDSLGREHGSTLGGQSVTHFGVLTEQVVGSNPSPPTSVSCLGQIGTTCP